ncbi:MAG: histidinol dehydrogenase [Gammaproteobacteria bacterium]|jgi:histidinol dehydrogenase
MSEVLAIKRLDTEHPDFWPRLEALVSWESSVDEAVEHTVREIIADVRRRGDRAVLEYTNRFDGRRAEHFAELLVPRSQLSAAYHGLRAEQRQAIDQAISRIRRYHERQRESSWHYVEADGTLLGQQVTALDRVGLYVPGGKAAYPSSVLMNAIPARVAGVPEVLMVVPAPGGIVSDLVLAAAHRVEVDRVITIGGAQAIAALAYGTASVPRVDKIVGPGNAYVAAAKRSVFGKVGIDMLAGPSEIMIVCDGKTPAEWIAMDLFSQAEHDERARALLLSPDGDFLDRVYEAMVRYLPTMERSTIIAAALASQGALVRVRDLGEAIDVVNFVAPEHVELSVDDPHALANQVHHAGAIFLGRYTAEVLGDYCAGPNHVLPTSGTARFSSPLGVADFQKRSSLIACSETSARQLGAVAGILARAEGLTAHARAAELRLQDVEAAHDVAKR